MEEKHRQGMGKRHGASMPSSGPSLAPHHHVVTNPEALGNQSFWLSMEVPQLQSYPSENKQTQPGQGTKRYVWRDSPSRVLQQKA